MKEYEPSKSKWRYSGYRTFDGESDGNRHCAPHRPREPTAQTDNYAIECRAMQGLPVPTYIFKYSYKTYYIPEKLKTQIPV